MNSVCSWAVRRITGTELPVRISIREDLATSTPAGELIFHVMAAIGQFGRALNGDRIESGA